MYFYVDESGHTGTNLFDPNQPTLYYGVLSSRTNIDVLAEEKLRRIRSSFGVSRLHAADLGGKRLVTILPDLLGLQSRLKFKFDLYRVRKSDHALISFFDQVFDQGMNPTVPWHCYWTPMRYILLLKLASLFDEDLLKRVWAARIDLDDDRSSRVVTWACGVLISRLNSLPDVRSREVLGESLKWAAKHPGRLRYNAKSKEEALSVAPNAVGFQSVMFGIASRVTKARPNRVFVTVDIQSQFNKEQKNLSDWYRWAKGNIQILDLGPGMPKIDLRGIPDSQLRFCSSTQSSGLELVDLFLWVFKRHLEHKELPAELLKLLVRGVPQGLADEISIAAIARRWTQWFDELPELTQEQLATGVKLRSEIEEARQRAMLDSEAGTGK